MESEKTNLGGQKKKTEMKLSSNGYSQKILETVKPKVCALCIKRDFVTHFTDFRKVKISVYDKFRFETKKFQFLLFFFCGNLAFRLSTFFSGSVFKKCTGVFCTTTAEKRLLVRKKQRSSKILTRSSTTTARQRF